MAEDWIPLPIGKPAFANLIEDAVSGGFQTAIENGYINELDGHTRFPGMVERVDLGGNARVYLHDFNGDGIAADSKGQVFRFDRNWNFENVTAVPVAGGRRVVFAETDRDLLMAAGGPIVRLRATRTEVLSDAAPLASHVAWIGGYTLAVEIDSGNFFHSGAGAPDQWDPLDLFAANSQSDNINSLIITPFSEVLLGGVKSIEQFEQTNSGDVPFARRWAIGAGGTKLPYAILFADSATWTINNRTELVRMAGQVPSIESDAFGKLLEDIDDWTDAWMGGYPDQPLQIGGQKFIILQAPFATNSYGTKGVTLGIDYRRKRFFSLYGWGSGAGLPRRWPAWSHRTIFDKHLVGGDGKIYELTSDTYRNGSELQRWLIRTSHMAKGDGVIVKAFRLRLVRGRGTSAAESRIMVRCSRDGRPFSRWVERGLGKAGNRHQFLEFGNFGTASTHRFEIACTDDAGVDLIGADVKTDATGH